MSIPPELLPVVQITLPIIVTFVVAAWLQNRSFDGVNRRLDDVVRRLEAVEKELKEINKTILDLAQRLARVEERLNIRPLSKN